MATLTHTPTAHAFISMPTHSEGNSFLDALRSIKYGKITISTPQKRLLEFTGPQKGPAAYLWLYDWCALDELVARGEVGFAESYMGGQWDTPDLPVLLTFALANAASLEHFFHGKPLHALWLRLKGAFHGNSLRGSRRNIMKHYDLGNDFYALWLDESMTYSCALFEGDVTRSLEAAQQAKYRRILQKIAAAPGAHILEIGCGWGGFTIAAAQAGLRVTAVTLSQKQAEYAHQRIKLLGLDSSVCVLLKDYRELEGMFDHIVSVGMFEHVGEAYWPVYFRTLAKHLNPAGKALVQSITIDEFLFRTHHEIYGFIEQYIFPGGMLPSKPRFTIAAAREGLTCKEIFAFGQDYARTLAHWLARFEARKYSIRALGYDETFLRLWRFYLASCIASFRTSRTDVMQALLTHA